MHTYTCVHTHTHTHTHTHACTRAHTHTRTHIYTCVHTHSQTHTSPRQNSRHYLRSIRKKLYFKNLTMTIVWKVYLYAYHLATLPFSWKFSHDKSSNIINHVEIIFAFNSVCLRGPKYYSCIYRVNKYWQVEIFKIYVC